MKERIGERGGLHLYQKVVEMGGEKRGVRHRVPQSVVREDLEDAVQV